MNSPYLNKHVGPHIPKPNNVLVEFATRILEAIQVGCLTRRYGEDMRIRISVPHPSQFIMPLHVLWWGCLSTIMLMFLLQVFSFVANHFDSIATSLDSLGR